MGKYNKDSVITRQMAWQDLKEDFTRFDDTDRDLHVVTDVFVNIVRMVFGTSIGRDKSQVAGRFLMVVTGLMLFFAITPFLVA